MKHGPTSSVCTRRCLLAATSAVGLLGMAGGAAHAQTAQVTNYLTALEHSGNPFLSGFGNGVTPGFASGNFQAFDSQTLPGITLALVNPALSPNPETTFLQIDRMTVNGNVVLPQGGILANTGGLAPAAVQGQLVAFNAAHGLPANYLVGGTAKPFPGLYLFGSTVTGAIVNAGTIRGEMYGFMGKTLPNGVGISLNSVAAGGITNSGIITATTGTPGFGNPAQVPTKLYGIVVQNSTVSGTILNAGSIGAFSADATTPALAYGIRVGINNPLVGAIVNTGALSVQSTPSSNAFGISVDGSVTSGVTNAGTISVAGADATGINLTTRAGNVINGGAITVSAVGGAFGIESFGSTPSSITNSGKIAVRGSRASAIGATGTSFGGNVVNLGTLSVVATGPGFATGIYATAATLSGGVTNSGLITVSGANPVGITANSASLFAGGILNNGTIQATTTAGAAFGISNSSTSSSGGIVNTGRVSVVGATSAQGIQVTSSVFVGGVANAGSIVASQASAGGTALAIELAGSMFSGGLVNASGGLLSATGTKTAGGLFVFTSTFADGIANAGSIVASQAGAGGNARAIELAGSMFSGGFVNASGGLLSATGTKSASGLVVFTSSFAGGVTNAGSVIANNTGSGASPRLARPYALGGTAFTGGFVNLAGGVITAAGTGLNSTDVFLFSNSFAGGIANAGTLSAAGAGTAAGITIPKFTTAFSGGVTNTGRIAVSGGLSGIGIFALISVGGGISNSGTIVANTAAIDVSQVSAGVSNTIFQQGGLLQGAVKLSANADRFVFTGGVLNGMVTGLAGNADQVSIPSGAATFAPTSGVASVATFAATGGTLVLQVTPANAAGKYPTIGAGTVTVSNGILVQEIQPIFVTTTYAKVFNATGTLSDGHTSLASASALIVPSLVPDGANAKDLVLTAIPLNGLAGETPNQQAAGSALQGLSGTPQAQPLLTALFNLQSSAQVLQALTDLSGQNLTQALRTSIETPHDLLGGIETRLITGTAAVPGEARFAQLGMGDQLSDAAAPQGGSGLGISAWAKGYGVFAQAPATIGGSRYHENRHGLLVGGDLAFTENLTLGVAFNYVDTTQHFADGAGSNEATSYLFSGYGGYHDGPWYANWVGGVGINNYNFSRSVGFLNATATGASSGYSYLGYAEGGYRLGFGAASVTPYAGFGVTHAQFNAFNETGAGIADLAVNSSDTTSVASTLGVKASMRFPLGSSTVVPEVRGAWQHEFRDSSQRVSANFAIAPGNTPFTVVGSNFGRDSALVGVGIGDEVSPMLKLMLDYDGKFTGSYRAHAVTAGLKVSF